MQIPAMGAISTPVFVAMIALIGAVAGALTSYRIAGRSVYINSITAERSKWIGTLRENIASYSGILAQLQLRVVRHGMKNGELQTENAVLEKLEEMNHVVSLIQLQLNPWGTIDRNILILLRKIVVRKGTDPQIIESADRLLIEHSQWLLKAEWEKVKYEAHGPIYRFLHSEDEKRWIKKYLIWTAAEGCLTELLAQFEKEHAKP